MMTKKFKLDVWGIVHLGCYSTNENGAFPHYKCAGSAYTENKTGDFPRDVEGKSLTCLWCAIGANKGGYSHV